MPRNRLRQADAEAIVAYVHSLGKAADKLALRTSGRAALGSHVTNAIAVPIITT